MKLTKDIRDTIADRLQWYLEIREQCIISAVSEKTADKQLKKMKKLIQKIRKGDMSVFNEKKLEEELPNIIKFKEQQERMER